MVEMSTSGEYELLAYRSYWEENLQKVEEIASHLEKNLLALEKKQKTELEQYRELERMLDFLLSIYSSYNCFRGREYLLKLKACLSGYSDQTLNKSVRFDVLHFLLAKVREHVSDSFDYFPRLRHEYRKELPQKKIGAKMSSLPLRWITFRASARWFIAAYDEMHSIPGAEATMREEPPGKTYLIFGGKTIPLVNYAVGDSRHAKPVRCYLIITKSDNTICYAASEIGKRISASRDVITPNLKDYSLVRKKYIRLFGRNHIFIDT